ncbi:MAG: efflux RND transporter periplasmic adaptor subunit [Planctomycetaceae bacterium]
MRHRLIYRVGCAAMLLGLQLGLNGCGGGAGTEAAGGPQARPALVRVADVERRLVKPVVSGVGTVVARRTSVVASGADGKVDKLLVRVGDIVEEDQELSILNMLTTNLGIQEAEAVLAERQQEYVQAEKSREDQIAEARAQMEAADVAMKITATRLQRQEQLSREGAGIRDSLDEARERAESAAKAFDAAKSVYEMTVKGTPVEQAQARLQAQEHQVAFLKAERDKRTTHAPFRGIVVAEHTESGQWLSKNDLVVTIADLLEDVEVVVNVDQRDLAYIQVGSEVQVEVAGAADCADTGRVVAIIPRSQWEQGSRTFPVKVAIPNKMRTAGDKPQPVLQEGMLARLKFEGPEYEATLVPKNALVRAETGPRLYVVVPGEQPGTGKAKPVMVQEGPAYGEFVEVYGDELQPGMQVIVEGAERLKPFNDLMIQPDAPAAGAAGTGATASGSPSTVPPQAAAETSPPAGGAPSSEKSAADEPGNAASGESPIQDR